MKKILYLSVAALTLTSLAACSKQSTTTSSSPATQTSASSSSVSSASSSATTQTGVTADQAKALAFQTAGVSADEVTNLTLREELENGQAAYDIDFTAKGTEYSYTIAVADGAILEQSAEQADAVVATVVTADQAKAVALADAGVSEAEVTNLTISQDEENGQTAYEVDFDVNGIEYSYTIDGSSSAILEKSQETVND